VLQKSLLAGAFKGIKCSRGLVQSPTLNHLNTREGSPSHNVGSFKNSKNSVDKVVFQGSPSGPRRNYLARTDFGFICTCVTKVT
jgi:hypothetical protein